MPFEMRKKPNSTLPPNRHPGEGRGPVSSPAPSISGPVEDNLHSQPEEGNLKLKIRRGLEQVASGDTVSHEEAKLHFAKWLR